MEHRIFWLRVWRSAWGFAMLCGLACTPEREARVLTVFAASSLVNVFDTLAQQFEADHPGTKVRLVYGGSQLLRTQIEHGATTDLFVSAHRKEIKPLVDQGIMHSAAVFAANRLVVLCRVSPACDRLTWSSLTQVKRLGLGLEASPIGWYTQRVLKRGAEHFGEQWVQNVRSRVVTLEPEVRRLRARVELGALDAAIVYQSDVPDQGSFRTIRPPKSMDQKTSLWVAQAKQSDQPQLAKQWQSYLLSEYGQDVLVRFGLERP